MIERHVWNEFFRMNYLYLHNLLRKARRRSRRWRQRCIVATVYSNFPSPFLFHLFMFSFPFLCAFSSSKYVIKWVLWVPLLRWHFSLHCSSSLKVNKSIAKSLKIIIHFIRYAFIGIVMKEKRLTMLEKKERERESEWSPLLFITRRIHVRPSRTQCARSFILLFIVHRVLSNAVWSVRNLHFSITTFSINKT